MRIVVLGDGLLGQTLGYEAVRLAPSVGELADLLGRGFTVLGHDQVDITSESSLRAMMAQYDPDVVVNTVAFHRLGECETAPQLAFDVNARGAERLAKLVRTIYISTDYVFNDGGPHDECLPGDQMPRSAYGRSKLAGEMGTLEHGGVVVRVAGLYGHYQSHKGPSFPQTILSSHDPIRLPTDQVFSPTYAPDAAERILALAQNPKAEGIYHATNRGAVSWAEFAEHILTYTRHERHVLPYVAHDDLRPRNSALKSKRLPQLPHWADGLGRWAQREGRYQFVSPKRVE